MVLECDSGIELFFNEDDSPIVVTWGQLMLEAHLPGRTGRHKYIELPSRAGMLRFKSNSKFIAFCVNGIDRHVAIVYPNLMKDLKRKALWELGIGIVVLVLSIRYMINNWPDSPGISVVFGIIAIPVIISGAIKMARVIRMGAYRQSIKRG